MDGSDRIPQDVKAGDVEQAGRRFAADMKARRTSRGITLAAIQRETRVSEGVLQEFETTGLVDNQIFNRVYLRSLVISYSRLVGLDPEDSLAALEAALRGDYDGALEEAETVDSDMPAGKEVSTPQEPPVEVEAEADVIPGTDGVDGRLAEGDHVADAESVEDDGHAPMPIGLGVGSRFEFIPSVEADQQYGSRASVLRRSGARAKTEISTAVHDFRPPENQKGVIIAPERFRAAALSAVVVIVSLSAILIAIRLSNRQDGAVMASVTSTAEEVSRMQDVPVLPPDPVPFAPPVVLADSITVTLVAGNGPLDPVRVQLDRDLRRPYWVDAGDSVSFKMSRRIVIQDFLQRLSVRIEGLTYPTEGYSDPERVVITRDSVEAFVGSLASR